jgi:hypothetical protein
VAAKRIKKPPYILEGGKITSHILKAQDMKEQTWRYFRSSPFWRALEKKILPIGRLRKTENRLFLIDVPEVMDPESSCFVKCYHSHSGVSFKSVSIYGMKPDQELVLTIEVEWEIDHEDFTKRYDIRPIPFDLVDDFTDQKFDIWVEKMLADREAKLIKKDKAQIEKFRSAYPEEFAPEFCLACQCKAENSYSEGYKSCHCHCHGPEQR